MRRPARGGVLALLVAGAIACGGSDDVPPELRGRWVAIDGPHAGRTFEIRCRRVLLDHGGGDFAAHLVRDVGRRGSGWELSLLIEGGNRDEMVLLVQEEAPDTVVLAGPSDSRWVRDASVPAPWDGIELGDCPGS